MAIIKIRNAAIDLDAAEIPNLPATKITSGTLATARLGSGTASGTTFLAGDQTYKTAATEFNDDKLVNDISTLALHQATNNNSAKYNLTNSNVDVYQDSSAIANLVNCSRDTSGEYIASVVSTTAMATNWSAINLNQAPFSNGASMSGNNALDWLDNTNQAAFLANVPDGTWIEVGSPSDNKFNRFSLGSGISDKLQFGSDKSWEVLTLVRDSSGGNINGIISGITSNHATNAYSAFTTSSVMQGASGNHGDPQDKLSSNYFSIGFSGQWNNQVFKYMSGGSATNISGLTDNSSVFQNSGTYKGYYAIRYVYDGSLSGSARLKYELAYPNHNNTNSLALQNIGGDGSTAGYILPTSGYPGWILGHYNGSTVKAATQMSYKVPTTTETTSATGNYQSTAQTANSSVSKISAVVTYTNASGTNTLNTDIILQVSANNGSSYTNAPLTAAGSFSSGVLQAVTNDISVTAGTQLKYKIFFANQASGSKVARINGVSLSY